MYFSGHYQNAYVTHDLDKAMRLFSDRFGLKDWLVYEPEMTVKTLQGLQPYAVRLATAWSGTLQLELIQPVSGFVHHYRNFLPEDSADFVPRFHHTALRRSSEQALRAEIAEIGLPLAFEGEVPGMVFVYLDAREWLGHYLEMCWATPEMWTINGWPADKPAV